jgi:hypothetical protein
LNFPTHAIAVSHLAADASCVLSYFALDASIRSLIHFTTA